MKNDKTDLLIHIDSQTDDEEELETTTLQLREELMNMNLESVDLVKKGVAPEGSKAGEELVTWGSLLVGLATSGGVLPNLVGTVQSWLSRRENQKITMEIDGDKLEVTGISSEEQNRLINVWINRHRKKGRNTND